MEIPLEMLQLLIIQAVIEFESLTIMVGKPQHLLAMLL
jgi:hypothetical protein